MSTEQTTPTSEEYFRTLIKAPTLAIPTTLMFIAVMTSMGAVWYYALEGSLPLWQGAIINGFLSYCLFSVIHDSSHRSLSSNNFLNEGIGGVALFFLFPYAPMVLLRWVHNKHHIHANGPLDPDLFEHQSPWWQVPFRWSCFDGYYIYYFFKYGGKVMKKHASYLIVYYSLLVIGIVAVVYTGYSYEVLMLWFVPTRISLFLIAVVFVILPHQPATVSQEEDPYMATTMRMGWEWLLTPLLVYQNYHLIHHLYPEIPFYKMHKVWYLKYDEINAQNISKQTAFGLEPANIESHKNFDHSKHAPQV
ncbi:MAG: fatty acid desaturase [Cycloclasticus sp.]|jgi:beta-carotene hydroxylase|nr:fatty acid desaturase [Cycloclasticus sp.]|tara:strand:- start:33876 stop:34790 length:915 start_codon:yes stop_codon:yes gene_type:complete